MIAEIQKFATMVTWDHTLPLYYIFIMSCLHLFEAG